MHVVQGGKEKVTRERSKGGEGGEQEQENPFLLKYDISYTKHLYVIFSCIVMCIRKNEGQTIYLMFILIIQKQDKSPNSVFHYDAFMTKTCF